MTPFDLSSLAAFQRLIARGGTLTPAQQEEFDALKRNLLPEVADDPATLFVDESSRPRLDGSNYNDTLKAMCVSEVENLVLRFGVGLVKAAVEAALTKA